MEAMVENLHELDNAEVSQSRAARSLETFALGCFPSKMFSHTPAAHNSSTFLTHYPRKSETLQLQSSNKEMAVYEKIRLLQLRLREGLRAWKRRTSSVALRIRKGFNRSKLSSVANTHKMASIILPVIAVTGVIRKISDITGNLIVGEALGRYWLKEDMEWIEREMRRIESYLADVDAIISTQDVSQRLLKFVDDITNLAEYVEKTIVVYENLSGKRKGLCGCFVTCTWSRHQLVMKIEKIRRRVTEITEAKSRYGLPDNPDKAKTDPVDRRRSYSHFDEPNVIGLDRQVDTLISRLENSESQGYFISIVGMPGVGKTTLAKKVYNSAKNFICLAWVYVSQNPSILELMKDIARQVGLVKEQREENLIENLYCFLKGKRYVIFLDDIWDTNTWDNLKVGFPNEGMSIVITSRYSSVGRGIGGESSLHELQPLDPNSSWELFSTLIMAHEENNIMNIPSELEDVGRLIIEKCGGVPLAIVTTAGMLRRRERRPDVWSRVLNSMDRDQECSNNLALKAPKSKLFDASNNTSLNSIIEGHRTTNHMFGNCKISMNRIDQKLESEHLKSILQNFRFIKVLRVECQTLPSFLPKKISNLVGLTYLELRGDGSLEVPRTISNLRSLETLDVQGCEEVTLPTVIWKMQRLKHILLPLSAKFQSSSKCWNLKIEEVNLPNLQTLYTLNGNSMSVKFLEKFTNLRKLGLWCSMEEIGVLLKDSIPISNKMESLILQIRDDDPNIASKMFSRYYSTIPEILSSNQNIDSDSPRLNFSVYGNLVDLYLEGSIRKLPELPMSLNKLALAGSRLEQDPMEELGKLSNLKKLQLRANSYIGSKMVMSDSCFFPSLEVFILEPMPALKTLKVEGEVMPKLKCPRINCKIKLEIHSERLRNIFTEFNNYLMGMSSPSLSEINFALPNDDFSWDEEEEDEIEDSVIQPTSRITDKGKDLLHETKSGEEIVGIQTATFGPDHVTPAYIDTEQCGFQKKLRDKLLQKQLELEKHKTESSVVQAQMEADIKELEEQLNGGAGADTVQEKTLDFEIEVVTYPTKEVEDDNATLDGASPSVVAFYNELKSTALTPNVVYSVELNPGIYGTKMRCWFESQDFTSVCLMKEISSNCILLYQTYLFRKLKELSLTNKYAFIDPTIASKGSGTTGNRAQDLNSKLGVLVPSQLALVPFNVGIHWVLLVIDPYTNTVHIFDSIKDSLNKDVHQEIKDVLDPAFKLFDAAKQLNLRETISYEIVQCPCQSGDTECGYFVMRFMRDIIDKNDTPLNSLYNYSVAFSQDLLDEIGCHPCYVHYPTRSLSQVQGIERVLEGFSDEIPADCYSLMYDLEVSMEALQNVHLVEKGASFAYQFYQTSQRHYWKLDRWRSLRLVLLERRYPMDLKRNKETSQGETQSLLNFMGDIEKLAKYVENTIIVYRNLFGEKKRSYGCFGIVQSRHIIVMDIEKIRAGI
ncbi:unnamed protein product [Fraxinus pennsylvanica]|uniref:Ubiquitin-like protease family profile domain-containing protein n=1 Tax=Fraxinus pennsylvanica TaxID=56036 RepID=A0AAD2ABX8_9LAMI|nr:unnamed protein product [Fraxinus pennsylvanica]